MSFILKKKYGQNFLKDENILKKIYKLIPYESLNILEIGPGDGKLTDKIILKKPNLLTLVEIYKELFASLKEKYNKHKNIELVNSDILKFNVYRKYQLIISNLPYNISSQILVKISLLKNNPDFLILMFQKEFAERILDKKLNAINTLVRCFYDITPGFNVSKNCFRPIPKVDSSVLTFKKIRKRIKNNEINNFLYFKRKLFSQKRKSLKRALKDYKINGNIDLSLRVENLDLGDFIKLFRTINF